MIKFKNINQEDPYLLFKDKYDIALKSGQKNIEAITISSYDTIMNEVDSRYVNLKYIKNDEFIFFSNYSSPKANAFISHNQIAALIYWPNINIQIRIKAKINKTSNEFNQEYFYKRSKEKNALAISSYQSKPIDSYREVCEKYNEALNMFLKHLDKQKCKVKTLEFIGDSYYMLDNLQGALDNWNKANQIGKQNKLLERKINERKFIPIVP